MKTKISNWAHSHVNSYKATLHALKNHQILKKLASNKDIDILFPGKVVGQLFSAEMICKEII